MEKEISKSLQEEAEKRYVLIDETERDDYDDFDGINSDLKLARLTFIEGATSDFVLQERDEFAMGFVKWCDKYGYMYSESEFLSKYKEHLEATK